MEISVNTREFIGAREGWFCLAIGIDRGCFGSSLFKPSARLVTLEHWLIDIIALQSEKNSKEVPTIMDGQKDQQPSAATDAGHHPDQRVVVVIVVVVL